MENAGKHRDIKLVTTERRSNFLVSERNYHTPKFLTEHLLATEMKKKINTYEKICLLSSIDVRSE